MDIPLEEEADSAEVGEAEAALFQEELTLLP